MALGLACGSAFWGFAGFFGVQAVFKMVPWLYGALKIGGALYLLATGLRLTLRSFRRAPEARLSHGEGGGEFRSGLAISIANPYSALSAASLFAATLPPTPPVWLGLAAVGLMSSIAIVWYGFVACALTVGSAARIFRSLGHWVDRIAGLAFVVFGVRMAVRD